ncbi:MAG: hypothetical protein VX930_10200, partial [Pseudomonadota bacterium]|nr:hypothetical protein [Pseudomonadota bacterium]
PAPASSIQLSDDQDTTQQQPQQSAAPYSVAEDDTSPYASPDIAAKNIPSPSFRSPSDEQAAEGEETGEAEEEVMNTATSMSSAEEEAEETDPHQNPDPRPHKDDNHPQSRLSESKDAEISAKELADVPQVVSGAIPASAEDEAKAKTSSTYYLRIARTLLAIIVVLMVVYFVHWILVNVFHIDVVDILRNKLAALLVSVPLLSSWLGSSSSTQNTAAESATADAKADAQSVTSPALVASGSATTAPASVASESATTEPASVASASATATNAMPPSVFPRTVEKPLPSSPAATTLYDGDVRPSNTTRQTAIPASSTNDESSVEAARQALAANASAQRVDPPMKRVLTESVEKSLVNLLKQFQ